MGIAISYLIFGISMIFISKQNNMSNTKYLRKIAYGFFSVSIIGFIFLFISIIFKNEDIRHFTIIPMFIMLLYDCKVMNDISKENAARELLDKLSDD